MKSLKAHIAKEGNTLQATMSEITRVTQQQSQSMLNEAKSQLKARQAASDLSHSKN